MQFVRPALAVLSLPLAVAILACLFRGMRWSVLGAFIFLWAVSLVTSLLIGGAYRYAAIIGAIVLVSPVALAWPLGMACAISNSPCP